MYRIPDGCTTAKIKTNEIQTKPKWKAIIQFWLVHPCRTIGHYSGNIPLLIIIPNLKRKKGSEPEIKIRYNHFSKAISFCEKLQIKKHDSAKKKQHKEEYTSGAYTTLPWSFQTVHITFIGTEDWHKKCYFQLLTNKTKPSGKRKHSYHSYVTLPLADRLRLNAFKIL